MEPSQRVSQLVVLAAVAAYLFLCLTPAAPCVRHGFPCPLRWTLHLVWVPCAAIPDRPLQRPAGSAGTPGGRPPPGMRPWHALCQLPSLVAWAPAAPRSGEVGWGACPGGCLLQGESPCPVSVTHAVL